jgi:molybdopterin/thiamine biosynthesis adenylyltransferase/rhodanese-related sulfurtransferase
MNAALNRAHADRLLPPLDAQELQHYSRHLLIPQIGRTGQQRLKAARVIIVGAGGLGSPLALYLAAAGVGTLGIVDFDHVDRSNLHRQVLYGTEDVGTPKLDAATRRLRSLNPHVTVVPHAVCLTADNALDVLRPYDLVVDGTDNFATRYLVNDACVLLGKPNVYAAIFRFEGLLSVFAHGDGPCYRCLYPEPPPPDLVPSCAEGGVLGVLPGIVGALQAAEAIKLLAGIGDSLSGRLLQFDALSMRMREFTVQRDPHCPVCGSEPTLRTLIDYDEFCAGPSETTVVEEIDAAGLQRLLAAPGAPMLIDVRNADEAAIARIDGARLIPLPELEGALHGLDLHTPVICYCQAGVRSERAGRLLMHHGFTQVRHLRGGIQAWLAARQPALAGSDA